MYLKIGRFIPQIALTFQQILRITAINAERQMWCWMFKTRQRLWRTLARLRVFAIIEERQNLIKSKETGLGRCLKQLN